jgi:hypothetical protein
MKKYFFALALITAIVACNNSSSESELKDPSTVHPPSDAIPESTRLVNDSVIIPDTTPGNGK